jgi:putative ABC transport system permease protein
MRTRALAGLVSQSIWRARGTLGLAAFGVAVGIAALSFFLSLSDGLRAAVGEIFPLERLEVVAPSSGGGALGLLGGSSPATLTDADLQKVRRIEGVADAQPRMRFAFPMKASGGEELLNQTGYTELIGDGVPAALVDDLSDPSAFGDFSARSSKRPCQGERDTTTCPRSEYCDIGGGTPHCEHVVPILVSPFLLELYNDYLAPGGGLPRMSRWMLDRARGLTFRLRLGESYLGRSNCGGRQPCVPRTVVIRLSGMSRHAVELGITLPLEYVQRWNQEYASERPAYSSFSIRTRSDHDVTPVVAELRRLGFEVPSNRAQQAGVTITIITALLALTSGLIIFVAGVNIAHTFFTLVHERRQEIGLYRALGASRGDVRAIILSEAAIVGLVAGLAGLGMAIAAAYGCDWAWDTYVPSFPFKPESLFSFSPSLIGIALGFAVGCCLVGAFLPARRAAHLDPARTLT